MTEAQITTRLASIDSTLDTLYAQAESSVAKGDRQTTYQSIAQIEASRQRYENMLAAAQAGTVRPVAIQFQKPS